MDATGPIHFFNRYTGQVEKEAVYGDGFLKWAYGNPLGKASVELLVKHTLFSKCYGWWMDRPGTALKVRPFLNTYGLDDGEFVKTPDEFESFNDFFSRELKPEARPITDRPGAIVFPADGRHLGFQNLSEVKSVFVKGQTFDLNTLLGDVKLADRYRCGSAVLSRLCPVDYHRFHFSVQGVPELPRIINGALYSVNPMALRQNIAYLWQNKRVITRVVSKDLGEVLIMEIGATNVGSIIQTFKADSPIKKGSEKGYFRFGGSATMTFFEPGKVQLEKDLLDKSSDGLELYARMGDVMGTLV
ncbi:MAG: phosphatidylserine decarboxylase [Verrucomicrobia bacterium]|jgi:phosphatidylserine decarboxylase|nr:phosphatidylserine decarboxylase [Verrucomicrobiota bacterium]